MTSSWATLEGAFLIVLLALVAWLVLSGRPRRDLGQASESWLRRHKAMRHDEDER